MAYIPVSPGSVSDGQRARCRIKDFSGGLCRSLPDSDIEDNQLSELSDMLVSGAALTVRGGVAETEKLKAPFHSLLKETFCDSRIFHCGDTLYRLDDTGLSVLSSAVPDQNSTLYRMKQKVYFITEDGHIYETDDTFTVHEIVPHIPVVTESADRGATLTVIEPANMMSKKVIARYTGLAHNSATLTLPYEIKADTTPIIRIDGVKQHYTNVSGKGNKTLYIGENIEEGVLEVEYTVDEESFTTYRKQIFGSRIAVCFGGSTSGGSRVFLTGNDAYPGMYFCSELMNPSYFPDTLRETLGDGSETVTDAEKRYEKLYFFTEHHIFSMGYSFDEKNGASFPVSEINTPIGCGMKGSVRLIDNTLVFAHHREGVFLLQSTDIFSELNVREISQNIRVGGAFSAEKAVCSCDFERKYCLFDGEKLLIWDYGNAPYYSSGNSVKSGRRLCWETVTGFEGAVSLFELLGTLYCIRKRGEELFLAAYDAQGDGDVKRITQTTNAGSDATDTTEGESSTDSDTDTATETEAEPTFETVDFTAHFATKQYDFGVPYEPKRLSELSFTYACGKRIPKLTLRFSGDGKVFYRVRVPLAVPNGTIRLRIPPYSAYRFRMEADIESGNLTFRDPVFTYTVCPRAKMR